MQSTQAASAGPAIYASGGYLPVEELLELAPLAEQLGLDGIAIPDHLLFPEFAPGTYPYSANGETPFRLDSPWPDPWVLISALAAVTTTLRFTTSIYLLALRHPLQTAKAIATAANISGGRVSVGVGAGWMREEFEAVGLEFSSRGPRLEEAIIAVRKLWEPGPVEHHGRFFSFGPLLLEPVPNAPIPILVGGASKAAFRRAVRVGDGCALPDLPPEGIPRVIALVRAALEREGRDPDTFEFTVKCGEAMSIEEICRHVHPGVSALRVSAWPHPGQTSTTLAEKMQALESFATDVLGPVRASFAASAR